MERWKKGIRSKGYCLNSFNSFNFFNSPNIKHYGN